MSKWIEVSIEGHTVGSEQTVYVELSDNATESQILEAAQDAVNEAIGGWGIREVPESEVPEGHK